MSAESEHRRKATDLRHLHEVVTSGGADWQVTGDPVPLRIDDGRTYEVLEEEVGAQRFRLLLTHVP